MNSALTRSPQGDLAPLFFSVSPSLLPSHFSPLFILHSCPPNGTIQDMQGRRRRRFTQLNHAIPIDNGAMMANSPSPSTAMRCACAASADPILFSPSPFRVGYLFRPRSNIAPRRVAPIGFRATKLDMVCVPILRPAGIALPALKLESDGWHAQLLLPVKADHPRNIVCRVRTSLAPPSPPTVAAA